MTMITEANEYHVSLRKKIESQMSFHNPEVKMGSWDISEYETSVTDSEKIRRFRKLLTSLSANK